MLLDFNGIRLPNRVATYDIPATVTLSRLPVAGGMGGYVMGAKRETRKYRAEGMYLSAAAYPHEAQQTIDQLRGQMGAKGVLRQQMKDGTIRRCNAWLMAVSPTHNNLAYITPTQSVTLDFESDEAWHEDSLTAEVLTAANSLYAINAGNVATARLKFTITSAITSSLIITNTTNGETLTYGAAKANGIALAIDCETGSVTLNGANAYVAVTLPNTQIHLMTLAAGENFFSFNTPITGSVEYRGCFV